MESINLPISKTEVYTNTCSVRQVTPFYTVEAVEASIQVAKEKGRELTREADLRESESKHTEEARQSEFVETMEERAQNGTESDAMGMGDMMGFGRGASPKHVKPVNDEDTGIFLYSHLSHPPYRTQSHIDVLMTERRRISFDKSECASIPSMASSRVDVVLVGDLEEEDTEEKKEEEHTLAKGGKE